MSRILRPGQRIQRVVFTGFQPLVDYDLVSAVCDLFQIAADLEVQSDMPPGTEFLFGGDRHSQESSQLPAYMPETQEQVSFFDLPPDVRYDGTIP